MEQLTAIGNFTDHSTQDLTTQVTWTSDDGSIVQVSDVSGSKGLITGEGVGSAIITASLNGIQGSTTITVSAATLMSITVTPANPSIAKGTTQQLTATGIFSDSSTQNLTSQVSWVSGNSGVATVGDASPTNGLVTGVEVGGPF
jgi:hypothetical protein